MHLGNMPKPLVFDKPIHSREDGNLSPEIRHTLQELASPGLPRRPLSLDNALKPGAFDQHSCEAESRKHLRPADSVWPCFARCPLSLDDMPKPPHVYTEHACRVASRKPVSNKESTLQLLARADAVLQSSSLLHRQLIKPYSPRVSSQGGPPSVCCARCELCIVCSTATASNWYVYMSRHRHLHVVLLVSASHMFICIQQHGSFTCMYCTMLSTNWVRESCGKIPTACRSVHLSTCAVM